MRGVHYRIGLLGGVTGYVLGATALMLAPNVAEAQFFPFFQQQPQRQAPPPPPPPQPQQSRPAQPAQAPVKKPQQPAQQKASTPAAPKAGPASGAIPYPEVRTACNAEIRTTCAGVSPGSAESVQCLRPNFAVHTPPCQAALSKAFASAAPAPAAAGTKPTEPAGTSASPRVVSTDRVTRPEGAKESEAPDLKLPAMRPTQEARWVNRYCKEDHSLLCQGVTFGQSRVLRCLLSHHTSLTNNCKQALAKR
jgi:hypothetical protein